MVNYFIKYFLNYKLLFQITSSNEFNVIIEVLHHSFNRQRLKLHKFKNLGNKITNFKIEKPKLQFNLNININTTLNIIN